MQLNILVGRYYMAISTTGKTVSFVKESATKERKFDVDAYQKFVDSLTFNTFTSTPFREESSPLSVRLDTTYMPMNSGFFDVEGIDKFSYIDMNAYNGSGSIRIYMKDVDAVINALTKAQAGFKLIRETGTREFPKPVGFDEWAASQKSDQLADCCASCN